jgi:uncharacterized OB-fold protein
MMQNFSKPLPEPTATSAPFWQAADRGVLELQYCSACDNFQYYPRAICANCWNEDIQWRRCSGRASVYAFSICHIPLLPSFKGDGSYVVAVVELEEGVRMTTNIIDCELTDVNIGMDVEAVFERVTDEHTLIKFRPSTEPLN